MGILKPYSNVPVYGYMVIGTLAVDGWAVTFGTAAPPSRLLAVPNVTAHPSTACVPTSHHLTWHYNCLCTLKGPCPCRPGLVGYSLILLPLKIGKTLSTFIHRHPHLKEASSPSCYPRPNHLNPSFFITKVTRSSPNNSPTIQYIYTQHYK